LNEKLSFITEYIHKNTTFVPFVLYPKYGDDGFRFTVMVAVITLATIGTGFTGNVMKNEEERNG